MTQNIPKFSIVTPILTLRNREESWEASAGPSELREIASTADRLGYFYLTCSEHVGIPTSVAATRGPRYYDPLATFGYMAAVTEKIRFFTNIVVLPYHHPLAVAKRYGTLDVMSEGRLMLGVGVGSLREEFELLGAEFEKRGEIYSEALLALRAALGKRQPVFHGEHFDFSDFIIDPCAVQQQMPIWLGGRTPLSLRRALAAGDGWAPFSLSAQDVAALLERAQEWPEWQERSAPLDVALAPAQSGDATRGSGLDSLCVGIEKTLDAGATVIQFSLGATSCTHYLEQIEAIAERVMPRFR
ncbi:TIGR03619 family F420-dependent LLM class oxidoreductase [Myxococcota bacterium]|nr:TIGR03619 family F420-dependent LLM class oxidoreductase [Myxococcota bacterium]